MSSESQTPDPEEVNKKLKAMEAGFVRSEQEYLSEEQPATDDERKRLVDKIKNKLSGVEPSGDRIIERFKVPQKPGDPDVFLWLAMQVTDNNSVEFDTIEPELDANGRFTNETITRSYGSLQIGHDKPPYDIFQDSDNMPHLTSGEAEKISGYLDNVERAPLELEEDDDDADYHDSDEDIPY